MPIMQTRFKMYQYYAKFDYNNNNLLIHVYIILIRHLPVGRLAKKNND